MILPLSREQIDALNEATSKRPEPKRIMLTVEEADEMVRTEGHIDFNKYDVEGPNESLIRKVYESTTGRPK